VIRTVKNHHSPQVTLSRWIFCVVAIAAFSYTMIAVAQLGDTVASAAAGVLFTIPLCSLGEWLVHGVLYHGRVPGFAWIRKIHHAGHHFALFPPKHYVQSGPYEFMRVRAPLTPFTMSTTALDNLISKWGQVALHFAVGIPLIVLPSWLLVGDPVFTGSVVVTLALISWLLAHVHGVIHTPRDRWIERMRWFQWLDRHHYIHHIDLSANINFLLPICDVLLGTQKMSLSAEETRAHPSFDLAKPQPHARPALARISRPRRASTFTRAHSTPPA
jgi:hypothetical protein